MDDTTTEQVAWALTTVVNPFADTKLMFFSSGPNNMLRFDTRSFEGDILHSLGPKAGEKSVGHVLASQSQLTSIIYKDMISVYGIINAGAPTKYSYQLALLSPITSTISLKDLKPYNGALTGYVDRVKGLAFLYLVALNSEGKPYIGEWALRNQGAWQPIQELAYGSFMASTSLSHMYHVDAKKVVVRFLVYQQSNGAIGLWNFKNKQTITVNDSSNRAAGETSVAAMWVPEDAEAGRKDRRIVVYFTDNEGYLVSANCVLADSTSFNSPSEKSRQVGSGYTVRQFAQLSIQRDESNKRNIIYGASLTGEILPIYHKWSELMGN
ncbi:hypothetical protein FPANT_7396 [Fusarium pseudoanthophilum]|uniref:Fucose-specific lectin n=1 Tax=Fusarium pseudoanthophilum TaxID=48495 RepID=A0A8H5L8J8_9HYPO|nr:hypothetical protein FPANT_7396 [Fusarium pseudoanthophilum]